MLNYFSRGGWQWHRPNYTVYQKTTLTLYTITSMHINRFR